MLAQTSLDVAAAEEVVRNDPGLVIAVGSEGVLPAAVLNAVRALFDTADGAAAATPKVDLPPAQRSAPLVPGGPPVEQGPPVPAVLPWLTAERDG